MDKKEEIKTNAAHLFANKGFHGSSMRDIASVCNIKASSIYNHYKSKSELLEDIFITHGANSVKGLLHGLKDQMEELSLEDGLHLFTEKLVKLWTSEMECLVYSIIIKHLDEYSEIMGKSYGDSVTSAIKELAIIFEEYKKSRKLDSKFSNEQLAWQFLAPIANMRITYLHDSAQSKGRKIANKFLKNHIDFFVFSCKGAK
ncbi:MAG: TetR/AcrR family transcriptional regulator [Bacteriovoracaceae bacterium]|nr:TetR/AcrR family transcriptional regulator [Bacteriovoracaceae bacterium]